MEGRWKPLLIWRPMNTAITFKAHEYCYYILGPWKLLLHFRPMNTIIKLKVHENCYCIEGPCKLLFIEGPWKLLFIEGPWKLLLHWRPMKTAIHWRPMNNAVLNESLLQFLKLINIYDLTSIVILNKHLSNKFKNMLILYCDTI